VFVGEVKQSYAKTNLDVAKTSLLKMLNEAEAKRVNNDDNQFISRCDYHLAEDFTRPWVQAVLPGLKPELLDLAKSICFEGYELRAIWFQQYNQDSGHSWHTHGCNYTGVFYVDFPDETPATEYIEGKDYTRKKFDVEEHDLLIFPSTLIHRAPINKSSLTKTIISFNINLNFHPRDLKNIWDT
jgi:hypothetical protein